MTALQSIILGIIQGLTELLPVSSSAHLNIFPWLLGWSEIPDSFDIALHFGTLMAITIFFFRDWIDLIKGGFNKVFKKEDSVNGRMFWYIMIATIPAGILGMILEKISGKIFNTMNKEMIAIAFMLIVMGILLYVVDSKCKTRIRYEKINFKQAFLIGMSQAIAGAFPGTSRSGITMTVARSMKIDRESAAKFSFLLSTPMIAAAVLVSMGDFVFNTAFVLGVLSSFIVGILVIKFLLDYLKKGSFKVFAVYRVVLGLIIIGLVIFR